MLSLMINQSQAHLFMTSTLSLLLLKNEIFKVPKETEEYFLSASSAT